MSAPIPMQELLAVLRACQLTSQTAHWTVSGDGYYGKHLLLERIYNETGESVDQLGERLVGYWGADSVEQALQSNRLAAWANKWAPIECPVARSLRASRDVRDALHTAYHGLQGSGQLTLGLDNLLQAIADQKDAHVYLLQQQLKTPS